MNIDSGSINRAAEDAVRAVPPSWPLTGWIAVNPFAGHTGDDLATAIARLERVAGCAVTPPRSWHLEAIRDGRITNGDLEAALAAAPPHWRSVTVEFLKAATEQPRPRPLPSVAELAARASGTDWPALIEERVGAWASAYFDEGQALWPMPPARDPFVSWRETATRDLTPEIAGLQGFAREIAEGPATAETLLTAATQYLAVPEQALTSYYHRLLMDLGGWAQLARYRLWRAELNDDTDRTAVGLLAVRMAWEQALFRHHREAIEADWRDVCASHARPVSPQERHIVDALLQDAAERSAQRRLPEQLTPDSQANDDRPDTQAVFCIDVRSEVFRRCLERVAPSVQTLGFAGFFGLPLAHREAGSHLCEARCPGLVPPALESRTPETGGTAGHWIRARASRAWKRFKLAAVSSFAFVESMGPVYAGKLLGDSLGLHRRHQGGAAPAPDIPGLGPEERAETAESVLRTMSLTNNFSRLVVFVGHGAGVTNNPHAGTLQCGACGGHAGDVNARALAGLLNDPDVRARLAGRGIPVPADTLFVGALHDTTSDRVMLFDGDAPSSAHRDDLARLAQRFDTAGELARDERARRLPRARHGSDVAARGRNWAELRPEWGLAGCSAFIVAPRHRTRGRDLGGRAFLHSYEWRDDEGFRVLEQILTAPVVVASWINLQYYGSTVAPETFGGGSKVLHNVTGGIGVVEGNGGALRTGLPWQSVHDGDRPAHHPLRLTVVIEAPTEAIDRVLRRHDDVRAMFDNRWAHLLAVDESGQLAWRYHRAGHWTRWTDDRDAAPVAAAG
ncbi:YbcC family protein [Arhodomonas aquaeolei]|uniref:YbcC family protein n=1 Tax=Arhodomonas aquaeolei TaxID=2369 RepID=UPI00036463FC|nr:DUF2309 domain-containing protein [Arhodomonas aquaeolei]